jgi:hypothetical protein
MSNFNDQADLRNYAEYYDFESRLLIGKDDIAVGPSFSAATVRH